MGRKIRGIEKLMENIWRSRSDRDVRALLEAAWELRLLQMLKVNTGESAKSTFPRFECIIREIYLP